MAPKDQIKLRTIGQYRAGELSRAQAAEFLGVSERTVDRWSCGVRQRGPAGIKHGNSGRAPVNKAPTADNEQIVDLVRRLYFDFNFAHARQMLLLHHDLRVSYARLHGICRKAGLGIRKKRRASKLRVHRERMANEGMLLQMDGSHHEWNGRDTWCLICLIDDATSRVIFARFFAGETTWACMQAMREVIEKEGLPGFVYTDQAGWAGGGTKRPHFSQFGRALEELGVGLLTTPHPQAKGRVERANQTFQSRLIPELRLYGINSMVDANRYLEQVFVPQWETLFAVESRQPSTRWRPLPPHVSLNEVLCMKTQRRVGGDHVVAFEGERYRITTRRLGSLRRKEVTVHSYEDGGVAIFYGHLRLDVERIVQPKRRWSQEVG